MGDTPEQYFCQSQKLLGNRPFCYENETRIANSARYDASVIPCGKLGSPPLKPGLRKIHKPVQFRIGTQELVGKCYLQPGSSMKSTPHSTIAVQGLLT